MIFGSSGILGLALGDRSITCAQVQWHGGNPRVQAQAVLELPQHLTFEQAGAVGDALVKFLRHEGFSSSRAVIGVPAKWLIALEKEIPPADEQAANAMLRLQSERMSSGDGGEMVFDYTGQPQRDRAGKVLLVGILRRQLDRIMQVADAAGLNTVAVTSTGLAMASAMSAARSETPSQSAILLLSRGGGEIVWHREGAARMLRHVPLSAVNGQGKIAVEACRLDPGSRCRRPQGLHPDGRIS